MVLVVDDNHYMRVIVCTMLRSMGITLIREASDGIEALEIVRDWRPDVIILDLMMEQLDGIEFIRQASALMPNAAFVMITGHNLSADQDKLDRLTALKGFLSKPFGWRKLADEIIRVWPDPATAPMHKADATSL